MLEGRLEGAYGCLCRRRAFVVDKVGEPPGQGLRQMHDEHEYVTK